jgi:hypothetical protein
MQVQINEKLQIEALKALYYNNRSFLGSTGGLLAKAGEITKAAKTADEAQIALNNLGVRIDNVRSDTWAKNNIDWANQQSDPEAFRVIGSGPVITCTSDNNPFK